MQFLMLKFVKVYVREIKITYIFNTFFFVINLLMTTLLKSVMHWWQYKIKSIKIRLVNICTCVITFCWSLIKQIVHNFKDSFVCNTFYSWCHLWFYKIRFSSDINLKQCFLIIRYYAICYPILNHQWLLVKYKHYCFWY